MFRTRPIFVPGSQPVCRGFGRTGGGGFVPTDIAGCKLWLDASQIVGLGDGDPVTQWDDMSGSGNNAVSVITPPTYSTNQFNGLPIVDFFSGSDGLVATLNLTRPYTIFLVASQTDSGNNRIISSPTYNVLISIRRASNTVYLEGDVVGSAYGASGVPIIGCLRVSASITTTFFANGADITTATASNDWGFVSLGNGSEQAKAKVAEVIMYDTYLSDGDRAIVEAYLATKYGL